MFDLLPRYESVQEVAKDLSPKIKTLQADLKIIQQFHDMEDLHSVALTQALVQIIMRSLPLEGRLSFNDQFMHFRSLDPSNFRPHAMFSFLAQYVNRIEKHYGSNPGLYDLNFSPTNVGIKAVQYEASNAKPKPPRPSSGRNPLPPKRPCTLCTSKGFQSNHYPLNSECGVTKLSSPDILKFISDNKVCPSCIYAHDPALQCRLSFYNSIQGVSQRMPA